MFRSKTYAKLPNLEAKDTYEEPEKKPKEKKKTSNIGTFLHLIKSNVGTGILAMPMAISNFGLVAGTTGIILLGYFCIYCMQLLVFCSKVHVAEKKRQKEPLELQAEPKPSSANEEATEAANSVVTFVPKEIIPKCVNLDTSKNLFYFIITASRLRRPAFSPPYNSLEMQIDEQGMNKNTQNNQASKEDLSLDYASTAFEAFQHGPKAFRSWAKFMRFLVNLLLVLTQFGFCCVYFLFVGESLHEVLLNTKVLPPLKTTTIMALELPFMILLNFIPSLDMLTGVSTTAIGLQSVGLLMMFMYFVTGQSFQAYYDNKVEVYLAPIEKWALFFGTAMFSFEGIGVILPLENEMKRKRSFKKIVNVGMTIVVILYLLIGVFGYLKYGTEVKPSITFNLPKGCISELIRLLFAVAIFLSYPLQMYVPFTFILPYMKEKLARDGCNKYGRIAIEGIIRAFLVSFTCAVSIGVPMLDLIISFIGAVASSLLAVILPPFIHTVTILKYDIKCKFALIVFDVFLAIFGLSGLFVGAYTSVAEMRKRLTNTTVKSYEDLMFSGIDEAILHISSNSSSCCKLFE